MVDRRFFDHDSPGGTTVRDRVERTGYLRGVRRWSLGENIGWASRSISSPAGMVKAWMESPGHREIILTRAFREAGVGIAMGVPSGRGCRGDVHDGLRARDALSLERARRAPPLRSAA